MEIFEILEKSPIVPALVLHHIDDAVAIVEALVAGGIQTIEVTLRTSNALEIVGCLREKFPKITVGVGTVLTTEQMTQAKNAGAQFAASPGLTRELLNTARSINLPYLPGVMTPSEVMIAQEMGYRCLKFFPVEYVGGVSVLKAFKPVFSDMLFCPAGGVDRSNFKDYLALANVICVGGSWLVTPNEVKEKDWGVITMMVKESLASLLKTDDP